VRFTSFARPGRGSPQVRAWLRESARQGPAASPLFALLAGVATLLSVLVA
jgi:hypothetical protein